MLSRVFPIAALALVACSKEQPVVTQEAEAPKAEAPKPPFTGTLTGERIMGSSELVHPFEPWASAGPKLEAQMGKATLVKGTKYTWGAAQGDDCWYVYVEKQADGNVGAVMDPMKVSKGGPLMNWDDCLTAAGVRKDPVEDPNAKGPPTNGTPVTVLALLEGATKARSKWDKAPITVTGLYMNVTNMTSNGVASSNVTITAAKSDLKNTIGCSLSDPTTSPTKMTQYTPITVSGTVRVSDMITGAGERTTGVGLDACSLTRHN